MSSAVPARAQCERAAARLKLQRTRTRKGAPSALVYLYQIISCLLRSGRRSTGSCEPLEAGALLIAAEQSVRDMNAALLRASVLLEAYVPGDEQPPFSELVADRALLILRAGWRRKLPDAERLAAEEAALALRLVWWSE
ncbi:hypothetical protein [Aquincola sp. J276]|uniref:hypothetical protein n=1 Tax=Aquincola sp. J276 TaxID=2898432 RepID=UPI002151509B|nr:hypothetical protein [Aquincola sp. J276]MCR5865678.1 hypothetical protein [Aquincola sp. J276]